MYIQCLGRQSLLDQASNLSKFPEVSLQTSSNTDMVIPCTHRKQGMFLIVCTESKVYSLMVGVAHLSFLNTERIVCKKQVAMYYQVGVAPRKSTYSYSNK